MEFQINFECFLTNASHAVSSSPLRHLTINPVSSELVVIKSAKNYHRTFFFVNPVRKFDGACFLTGSIYFYRILLPGMERCGSVSMTCVVLNQNLL
jgi:hypothetical protein